MPSTKTYPADVLTVAQLAQCLKGAATLDETNERLEVDRTALRSSVSDVDQSKAAIEQQRSNLNRQSKASVNAFNASVNRYNTLVDGAKNRQINFNSAIDAYNVEVNSHNNDCVKKYYASDLPDAKKLAGITIE
jgi:multidrug resistance efflux pump